MSGRVSVRVAAQLDQRHTHETHRLRFGVLPGVYPGLREVVETAEDPRQVEGLVHGEAVTGAHGDHPGP